MTTTTVACPYHRPEHVTLARQLHRAEREVMRVAVLAALRTSDHTAGEIADRLGWAVRPVIYYCGTCSSPYLGQLTPMHASTDQVRAALQWHERHGRTRRVVITGVQAHLWTLA